MSFKNLSIIFPKKFFIPIIVLIVLILLSPLILVREIRYTGTKLPTYSEEFPITVDPERKIIIEDQHVEAFLQSENSPLVAFASVSFKHFRSVFEQIAIAVSHLPLYQHVALVSENRIVKLPAGLRKEEVGQLIGAALKWNKRQIEAFTSDTTLPELNEGMYASGTYVISRTATPEEVRTMIRGRFEKDVLSRYTQNVSEKLPLETALVIASLIQRETMGTEDMRMVSGIIWNRIFINMNLQLDATLQYVKANSKQTAVWWPQVVPKDKYIKSPYNTYERKGLPPAPIASPSVAAIVAALNPMKTECVYYFHDSKGSFHCSKTYPEHVALLKKHYGRGK